MDIDYLETVCREKLDMIVQCKKEIRKWRKKAKKWKARAKTMERSIEFTRHIKEEAQEHEKEQTIINDDSDATESEDETTRDCERTRMSSQSL